MIQDQLTLVKKAPLPFLLSLPKAQGDQSRKWPLLCFLHGLGEGPPTDIFTGITAHGPLRQGNSPLATEQFIVAAPQLPARGDNWHLHAKAVMDMVHMVQEEHGADPHRTYLTGFSFGANGVFDLALRHPSSWSALWPVDPTRVPEADPGLPVWLSSGEASRHGSTRFIGRLGLKPPVTDTEERVYLDEGLDHVGTATSAYRSDRIYLWLLSKIAGNTH